MRVVFLRMCAGKSGCAVGTGGRGQCSPHGLERTLPTHMGADMKITISVGTPRPWELPLPPRGMAEPGALPGTLPVHRPPVGHPEPAAGNPFGQRCQLGRGARPLRGNPAPSPPKLGLWGGDRLPPFSSPRKRVSGLTRRHQDFVLSPVH